MARNLFKNCLLLLLLLMPLVRSSAQISVSATTPKTDYLIGDRIPVQLTVKHPKGYTFSWPLLTEGLEGLELSDSVIANHDTTVRDTIISSKTVNLAAFDSGTYTYPSRAFVFQKAGDTAHVSIESDPLKVHVNVITVDTTKDIKPIVGPIQVQSGRSWVWWILGIAIVLLAAAIYFFRNKSKAPEPLHPSQPSRPPKEVALEALDELEKEKLYEKDDMKQHYIRLAEIMKRFLADSYGFNALEMTTTRTIKRSEKYLQNPSLHSQLSALLRTADLVKFAKWTSAKEEAVENLDIARNIVKLARSNREQPGHSAGPPLQ
jgi:hypothetical protein